MLAEVKKCAEAHDIKGLRYIFVDCLDVDPTFEKYRKDYEYCKSIEGLFEVHQPLNGISMDKNNWTINYWEQLKLDLMKNFSMTRFEHMIVVAKVVYADKIVRLLSERNISQEEKTGNRQAVKIVDKTSGVSVSHISKPEADMVMGTAKPLSDAERQEKRLAMKKLELEAENRRIEEKQAAQKARIEASSYELTNNKRDTGEKLESKKMLGIVLAVIAVVAVIFTIMILH